MVESYLANVKPSIRAKFKLQANLPPLVTAATFVQPRGQGMNPLTDLLARGGSSMNGQQVSSALINLGTPTEKAMVTLLNERNIESLRDACNILQQIGAGENLAAQQKPVGDSESSVSQAAGEAIRSIKLRQSCKAALHLGLPG
jgi:hypothetical protein